MCDVFNLDTPTQGELVATRLVERLPTYPTPEIASLGANPTQMEGHAQRLPRHQRSDQHTPPKPPTDLIEVGRRTARSYRNPINYQPRMLLITAGLNASPQLNYKEPEKM